VTNTPTLKETGRTASGAIIRKIETPVPMPAKPAAAGKDQGPEHWPRPTAPGAKLHTGGAVAVLSVLDGIGRPESIATRCGWPRRRGAPIATRSAAELERAAWKIVTDGKSAGPYEKPPGWPAGAPWYPGCDLNPATARNVVEAERRAAEGMR
jgi:hypothetical protein